ncbi:hypothetical protein [Pleionea sp. CnH1-48]|uniref:hypothetical protein n=1 Tax=Pleionea sp. CnH1-48 TaxID=2954494 RepID=UPI0020969668|nr:hypothetical protein [Pleionea sp. CnH1-48]MCO7224524.1 hypothetical protein [Pleionea sp. CnH1-48]
MKHIAIILVAAAVTGILLKPYFAPADSAQGDKKPEPHQKVTPQTSALAAIYEQEVQESHWALSKEQEISSKLLSAPNQNTLSTQGITFSGVHCKQSICQVQLTLDSNNKVSSQQLAAVSQLLKPEKPDVNFESEHQQTQANQLTLYIKQR